MLLVGGSGVVRTASNRNIRIGGLVGRVRLGRIDESWFVGRVEGRPGGVEGIGGLVGGTSSRGDFGIRNNWAQARVISTGTSDNVGGLIGYLLAASFTGVFTNSWAGGKVSGGPSPRGLVGRSLGSRLTSQRGYSDRSTSDGTPAGGGTQVNTMVGLTPSGWSTNVWNFGAANYPFLKRYDTMRPGAQAAFYALHQTRLLFGETIVPRGGSFELVSGGALRLDTNGFASDDPANADPTPTPSCALSNPNEVQANTNYNGVTVLLRSGDATFSLPAADECNNVQVLIGDGVDAFMMTVVVMAGEASVSALYSFTKGDPPPPVIDAPADAVVVAANAGAVVGDDICVGKRRGDFRRGGGSAICERAAATRRRCRWRRRRRWRSNRTT